MHPLILGGNVFGWTAAAEASHAVLDAFLDGGGTAVDTANTYSAWAPGNPGGVSERIIGDWLRVRGARDRVFVATKVGMEGGDFPKGLGRDAIRRGIEGSLQRLGVDRVDLYYAHEDDPATPLEETVAAFGELVEEGLIGLAGASNYSTARFAEALDVADRLGVPGFRVLQPEFNLIDRDGVDGDPSREGFPDRLRDLCLRRGVGVMPYWTLARGFLTGKYREGGPAPDSPRAAGVLATYGGPRPRAALALLDEIAAAHGATPAQIALAWLMAYPAVVGPIASATTPEQVRELLGAADVVLSDDEVARLNAAGGR
ncbi:MAG: aldo/keto reductase [Thermoleophilia bacterium]|nr:aldo/keto reductase [Thermoleophilia bacterium]